MASKSHTFRFDAQTEDELRKLTEIRGLKDISEVVRQAIHRDYAATFPSGLFTEEKPKSVFELKSVSEIILAEGGEVGNGRFHISTGSASVDELLSRTATGIGSGVITHVYGASGVGKTQMGITLAANASKIGKVLYIDTERGNVLSSRIREISEGHDGVIDNIMFERATNVGYLESLIDMFSSSDTIGKHKKEDFRLIVVDSISSLYRDEIAGNENAQKRIRAITSTMSKLASIAEKSNIAVFVTNQVYTDRGMFGSADVKPYAENAIRSKAFTTMHLRSPGHIRVARVVASVSGTYREARYEIDRTGIRDIEE